MCSLLEEEEELGVGSQPLVGYLADVYVLAEVNSSASMDDIVFLMTSIELGVEAEISRDISEYLNRGLA